ncbi:MAG: hypothetical protein HN392_09495 [Anaerolineae bacterium]|jgi:YYY domain-containing protein|nr:hypothetical protein [Anaerolineae bacterium]MBT7782534.1 hypothetical protein [Anaerolineae bacterium]
MKNSKKKYSVLYDIALLLVILVGFLFRSVGLDWDDGQHLHPDERFLTMVESSILPVDLANDVLGDPPLGCEEWGGYFDTECSSLNPHNRGHGFFVYGTLPIFATRYTADIINIASGSMVDWVVTQAEAGKQSFMLTWLIENADIWTSYTPSFLREFQLSDLQNLQPHERSANFWAGYGQINLIGRQLSAFTDLLSIVLLYFIVARVYNRKVALLSAAFSALAVLQIQQSHFFTVDTFVNFFMFLAIYFAVEIAFGEFELKMRDIREGRKKVNLFFRSRGYQILYAILNILYGIIKSPLFWLSIGFGFALGMAVASKINAAVLAMLLPTSIYYRYWKNEYQDFGKGEREKKYAVLSNKAWTLIIIALIAGATASFIAFRVFQPYAFSGPSIFNIIPNETWIQNIADQRAQASGDADLPFAFQWARRSHLYSFENLTKWGLGLPLGILAWAGFLLMAWRIFKGEKKHLLLWGWTAAYFFWQSMQFNPTMRYQLPIYPLLAMMAAYFVFDIAESKLKIKFAKKTLILNLKTLGVFLGSVVLILTALWAYAFVQIYQRPHSRVAGARWIYNNVPAAVNLNMMQVNGENYQQPVRFFRDSIVSENQSYNDYFVAKRSGLLHNISFAHIQGQNNRAETLSVKIALHADAPLNEVLATASLSTDFSKNEPATLALDSPISLVEGQTYYIDISTNSDAIIITGSTLINESSWDDGLPLRIDGYDAFGGLYPTGLNMEMYWVDDQVKVERLTTNLEQGDYLFLSSNRQWATLPRVPERYPLTKAYYEYLIGCPPAEDVIWCYNTARPGDFEGGLGYELVHVEESFPTLDIPGLFHWEANDQFAEEAFTVYDHTKVLIFKKTDDFDVNKVRALLSAVDISNVVHLTPKAAGEYEAPVEKSLMLSESNWEVQRAGGTWSELFDIDALKNKYPFLGLLLWYFTIFILGLFTYPIVRRIFPGLSDKGYPLSRGFGLLLLAYFPWLFGSLGIAYSRLNIALVFGTIMLIGAWQGYVQRDALKKEWAENRKYYLMIEGLFLALFLVDLLIRIGNPDLWHPSKGGERPMDLSYLHAILKSTTFPPYDPWFAGGYLNYYYFGFVLVGTPVKLLGLTPTVAYNYILPTLFGIVGINAFSVGWNLLENGKGKKKSKENLPVPERSEAQTKDGIDDEKNSSPMASYPFSLHSESRKSFIAGISATAGMILLGNLGTIRTVYHGFQRIIDGNGHYADISTFEHLWLAMQGFWKMLTDGAHLPLRVGDWYWLPSRVIPAPGDVEPITEFPLFTFLYSDLHAHMLVLPLTTLAIAWAISFLYARGSGTKPTLGILLEIAGASLIVGAMRPTNTWDLYAYLPLLAIIIGYALFKSEIRKLSKNLNEDQNSDKQEKSYLLESIIKPFGSAVIGMAIFFALSTLFYYPYLYAFGQAYGEIRQWTGAQTPLTSYFVQWGLFLFVIVSWMWWETHEWMAETPLSALRKISRHWINLVGTLFFAIFFGLVYLGVSVGWVAVPLLFWAGVLIFRRNLGEGQRLVLFLTGTGLALTIVVEVIVLSGDIGRMNTVFKLYLQTWTFFALSAGAALGWLLPEISKWTEKWQSAWKTVGMVLLAGALLFTLTGTLDKVRDRVQSDAPAGLDGMKYMETAHHWDEGDIELGEDYVAILWMRENVQGSPVIVEANTPEYRWGSRYTIYTGLPSVLGWNWHQRQQRALNPPHLVTDRVAEIRAFYETTNIDEALAFIEKYHIEYIVLGQVEQNYYAGAGLEKFAGEDGVLWDEVFHEASTAIYKIR